MYRVVFVVNREIIPFRLVSRWNLLTLNLSPAPYSWSWRWNLELIPSRSRHTLGTSPSVKVSVPKMFRNWTLFPRILFEEKMRIPVYFKFNSLAESLPCYTLSLPLVLRWAMVITYHLRITFVAWTSTDVHAMFEHGTFRVHALAHP